MGVGLDSGLESNTIDLVENLNARDVGRPNLGQYRLHGILASHAVGVGRINHMQEQVRLNRLLQGGLEGLHQRVWQGLNEPHRVREHHESLGRKEHAATGRVEGGKKLIGGIHPSPRKGIKECGLSRIRVADKRDIQGAGSDAGTPTVLSLFSDTSEPLLELLDPLANEAPVRLELGLAWATKTNTALLALKVSPTPHKAC
jgi:hypothetical protein